jgi:hypothetical protein
MIRFSLFKTLILCTISVQLLGQGIPSEITYEPDEGGYPPGYTPAKKLGKFDLSSQATNEPFRHLFSFLPIQRVVWDQITDYRDFGIRAMVGLGDGKPKENNYADINEAFFKEPISIAGQSLGTNPIYLPDPERVKSAQGQEFKCFGGPFKSVRILSIDNDAKWNPFLLSATEIDYRARYVANTSLGYIRWDIEAFDPAGWDLILKGRQVWANGKYRHAENGGADPYFRNLTDPQFFDYVIDRWSFVFTELMSKTRLYSQQSKVWLYGYGPLQVANPFTRDQFDAQGNIANHWRIPNTAIWKFRNSFNNKTLAEELTYMEPWDLAPSNTGVWAVLQYSQNDKRWVNTDIIRLRQTPLSTTSAGAPTRYHVTMLGREGEMYKVRISLHAQDGSLRKADRDYGIKYEHWKGHQQANIAAGSSSAEMLVPELNWQTDDQYLILVWNTMYCMRNIEPTKLGFINWQPSPRTEYLFTSDIFDQRVYDAMIGFTNLQNFGLVNWEGNTIGKVNPMVRESIILAHKKIAPYKSHIENQTLCFTDISTDDGKTWTDGGYPNAPFQQRYNGWWVVNKYNKKEVAPLITATYNATHKTILVGHLNTRQAEAFKCKIRVRIPNSTQSYIFDINSTSQFKYSMFSAL